MSQTENNKTEQIKGRVTRQKLIDFLNRKFEALEIDDYEVFDIISTRYNSDQIEGGAFRLMIRVRCKSDHQQTACFGSAFTLSMIEEYIKNGYSVVITMKRRYSTISDFEIDVK